MERRNGRLNVLSGVQDFAKGGGGGAVGYSYSVSKNTVVDSGPKDKFSDQDKKNVDSDQYYSIYYIIYSKTVKRQGFGFGSK